MKRRKKNRHAVARETKSKTTAPPDLINGRAMMTVSTLYESIIGKGLEHKESRGLPCLRAYLKDYKKYQDEVRHCLASCYEVLIECREEEGTPVDPNHIRLIKKTVKEEMKCAWEKKRHKTEPKEKKEDIDWETRFANGEFDLG